MIYLCSINKTVTCVYILLFIEYCNTGAIIYIAAFALSQTKLPSWTKTSISDHVFRYKTRIIPNTAMNYSYVTEMSSEEEEFEVDMIINDRIEKGEEQYLIRWKNYGP